MLSSAKLIISDMNAMMWTINVHVQILNSIATGISLFCLFSTIFLSSNSFFPTYVQYSLQFGELLNSDMMRLHTLTISYMVRLID